jgi:hypothetical protein
LLDIEAGYEANAGRNRSHDRSSAGTCGRASLDRGGSPERYRVVNQQPAFHPYARKVPEQANRERARLPAIAPLLGDFISVTAL